LATPLGPSYEAADYAAAYHAYPVRTPMLKLNKTYPHLIMVNDRLSELLVITVESDIAAKISLDDAVDVFFKNEK
jgi:hypothetical protein